MRGERRGRRKRRKERDRTVKNWNIEREIVEDEKPSLIYIHTLLFYIYIYTCYMDTLCRGRRAHSWTTFPFYRVYAFLSPFPAILRDASPLPRAHSRLSI